MSYSGRRSPNATSPWPRPRPRYRRDSYDVDCPTWPGPYLASVVGSGFSVVLLFFPLHQPVNQSLIDGWVTGFGCLSSQLQSHMGQSCSLFQQRNSTHSTDQKCRVIFIGIVSQSLSISSCTIIALSGD